MKTGVRLYLILFKAGFLCLPLSSLGQTDRFLDKVVLNNGSVIWGVAALQDQSVKVFLSPKDSLSMSVSMIKSIKTQKLNPELYLERAHGVYYQVSMGVLLGKDHSNSEIKGSFSSSLTSGYRFSPLLAIGLGVGLNYYPNQIQVPIYLDIQGDLSKGRVTPFYQLSVGWSWADERGNISQIEQVDGGYYLRPSLGVRWHFAKHSWHFQLSYVRQNSTTYFEPLDFGNGNVITNVEDRTFQRVGISTGISF